MQCAPKNYATAGWQGGKASSWKDAKRTCATACKSFLFRAKQTGKRGQKGKHAKIIFKMTFCSWRRTKPARFSCGSPCVSWSWSQPQPLPQLRLLCLPAVWQKERWPISPRLGRERQRERSARLLIRSVYVYLPKDLATKNEPGTKPRVLAKIF